MQQEKALKILKANLPFFVEEYGVKKIGVFPWEETNSTNCECECGKCCGYHPDKKIGVAVEYVPEAKPGWDFVGLQQDIADLFGCDILLLRVDGRRDPRFWRDDSVLEEVVYLR